MLNMEVFLKDNHFEYLSPIFEVHGVNETNFFTKVNQSLINTILKDNNLIDQFSSLYYVEKMKATLPRNENASESLLSCEGSTVDNEASVTGERNGDSADGVSSDPVKFNIQENSLTKFLQTSSVGKGIIGIYESTGVVKERQLKDLVIVNELEKDIKRCKIFPDRFAELRSLTIEAFPTEKETPLYWYEAYVKEGKRNKRQSKEFEEEQDIENSTKPKRKTQQGHRGVYYSSYKYWRKYFAQSGLKEKDEDDCDSDDDADEERYTDLMRGDYILEINETSDPTATIRCWEQHSKARDVALKQVTSINVYLSSFKCLNTDLAPLLLQYDFNRLYKDKDLYAVVEKKWPLIAKDLLQVYIHHSKSKPEVKTFLSQYDDRIDAIIKNDLKDQISVLAFLGLPYFLTHKPNVYMGEEDTIPKSSLLDSFILVCNGPEESIIDERIKDLENTYKKHELVLPLPPTVILWGTFDEVKKCYVLINNYKHSFINLEKAVQFGFVAYKAFHLEFPEFCMPAWSFIQRKAYQIQLARGISSVDDLVKKFNALVTAPKKRKSQDKSNKDSLAKKKKISH